MRRIDFFILKGSIPNSWKVADYKMKKTGEFKCRNVVTMTTKIGTLV